MKVKRIALDDVISIKTVIEVRSDDDEDSDDITSAHELDEGVYAIDSKGRVWVQHQNMSKLFTIFVEETSADGDDPPRRRR